MNTKNSKKLNRDLFGEHSYLRIHKDFLRALGAGFANTLANMIDKEYYFETNNQLIEKEWFFLYDDNQVFETGLSLYSIKKARNLLKELGLIQIVRKGIPPKNYYKLKHDKIQSLLGDSYNGYTQLIKKLYTTLHRVDYNYLLRRLQLFILYKETKDKETKENYNKRKITTPFNKNPGFINMENKTPSNHNKITPSKFDLFYKSYPRKINQPAAKKAFNKICTRPIKNRPTLRELISRVKQHSQTEQWGVKINIPYPSTWLNKERWLMSPEEVNEAWEMVKKINGEKDKEVTGAGMTKDEQNYIEAKTIRR